VLGGTQSLHTNSLDETYALPTKEAVTLALRTQQVIAHESGVADTADPLAGSYWVEAMTADLEARARALLAEVDARGGMLDAIAEGWVQGEIHEAAYRWQRDVESGERTVVGVNKFGDDRPVPAPPFQHDPEVEKRRAEFLAEWRSTRDRVACDAALLKLDAAARGTSNLVPTILEALTAKATLGEVCDALRAVFGVHRPGEKV